MKGKKKLILVSIALLFALVGLITTTVAWLTSTGTQNHTFVMGEVNYDLGTTGAANNKLVVPGQQILDGITITLKNKSTCTSQVRVQIKAQETTKGRVTSAADSQIKITLNGWAKGDDGYYYYGAAKPGDVAISNNTSAGEALTFAPQIVFDGAIVGNAHAGSTYTITIMFQAKQAEFVEWADMGNINFSTGLASK